MGRIAPRWRFGIRFRWPQIVLDDVPWGISKVDPPPSLSFAALEPGLVQQVRNAGGCHAGDRAHCRDVHCTDEQEPLGHRTAGQDLLELCGEANDFTSLRCLVAEVHRRGRPPRSLDHAKTATGGGATSLVAVASLYKWRGATDSR